MTAQSGTLWALSVRTTASPAAYTPIAGLRTRSFKVNNNPVDVTTADSADVWRELLEVGISVLETHIPISSRLDRQEPRRQQSASLSLAHLSLANIRRQPLTMTRCHLRSKCFLQASRHSHCSRQLQSRLN